MENQERAEDMGFTETCVGQRHLGIPSDFMLSDPEALSRIFAATLCHVNQSISL